MKRNAWRPSPLPPPSLPRTVGPGCQPVGLQGPLARFGDTAANSGTLALLNSYDSTRDLPVAAKTFCASSCAAAWRINLMPIDAVKTTLQVEGARALPQLRAKVAKGGLRVLYHGALAASLATFAGISRPPWAFLR